jgi:hypothetical protein
LISLDVLGEKKQMVSRVTRVAGWRATLATIAGGHIGFHPQDRLDAFLFALSEEFDDTKHAAMVGDRDAIHA